MVEDLIIGSRVHDQRRMLEILLMDGSGQLAEVLDAFVSLNQRNQLIGEMMAREDEIAIRMASEISVHQIKRPITLHQASAEIDVGFFPRGFGIGGLIHDAREKAMRGILNPICLQ